MWPEEVVKLNNFSRMHILTKFKNYFRVKSVINRQTGGQTNPNACKLPHSKQTVFSFTHLAKVNFQYPIDKQGN